MIQQYGLIGRKLSHSFSAHYFNKKFQSEKINATYSLFEKENLTGIKEWIQNTPSLRGLNVTIPYKTQIINITDALSLEAVEIGAVNTLKIHKDGKIVGYNTDAYGFEVTLIHGREGQKEIPKGSALVLGTGGASKAVCYVLDQYHIPYRCVSRTPTHEEILDYESLLTIDIPDFSIIINTTPVGMYPEITQAPNFPYSRLNATHRLIDLIYNPEETQFMKEGIIRGAYVQNGLKMLYLQAEKAWEIWQSK